MWRILELLLPILVSSTGHGCNSSCTTASNCITGLVCSSQGICNDHPNVSTPICSSGSSAHRQVEDTTTHGCGYNCTGVYGWCSGALTCNNGVCGDDPDTRASTCSSKHRNKIKVILIAVFICIAVVLATGFVVGLLRYRAQKRVVKARDYRSSLRKYSLAEVREMTDNFSGDNLIGQGGFGFVYRGTMRDGFQMAVKRERPDRKSPPSIFYEEIRVLERVRHRHIVEFLGYSDEQGDHMLLFEYMGRGNLRMQLHQQKSLINWGLRMRIAYQIASALDYLHHGANPPIIHLDVKPENILLGIDFTVKIADFGLSKMGHKGDAEFETTMTDNIMGSKGYIDPEYSITYTLSPKSDVYSFGIILLELISGKKAVIEGKGSDFELLGEWASRFRGNKEMMRKELSDPVLAGSILEDELAEMGELALWCVAETRMERPSMADVKKKMEVVLGKTLVNNVDVTLGTKFHGQKTTPPSSSMSSLTNSSCQPSESEGYTSILLGR